MTTWYIDPVAGTDANASAGNGDSFATRRKKIDNLVAAAIAPGDDGRIIGSPDATSLGINGTFTEGPYSTAVAITSSTNATPIVVTLNSSNYALLNPSVDDTVIITGHTTNTNANGVWELSAVDSGAYTVTLVNADASNSVGNGIGGVSGTIRKITSCRVKLASVLTKTVALTGNKGTKTNWTASANVTCTVNTTDYKEGADSQQIAIAAGFTTGLAAYYPLGASTDFSAYKQVTFLIKQTAGTIGAAGATTLTLCSDTAGATPVDTFAVPALGALNRWVPVTVDKGSALGSAIQSVAFNVVTDNAAQTFLITNIQACKDSTAADSLSLQSLIGKSSTGGEFYAIQSINGTRVMLEQETNTIPAGTPATGYFGTTETVTTYKRETFKLTLGAATTTAIQTVQDSGTEGSLITFTGGWNTTDMSTQTMETWFDGVNGLGRGLVMSSKNYIGTDKLSFVRYYQGSYATASSFNELGFLALNNCSNTGAEHNNCNFSDITIGSHNNNASSYIVGSGNVVTLTNVNGSTTAGITPFNNNMMTVTNVKGSTTHGIHLNGVNGNRITATNIKNNTSYGVYFQGSGDNFLMDATLSGNGSGDVGQSVTSQKNYLLRCTLSSSTEIAGQTAGYLNGGVQSQNHDNTTDNHLQVLNNGTIQTEATVRHTASGIAWKLSPTSTTYVNSYNPFSKTIAEVPCSAGSLVTATLWTRRTNTGLTVRFVCKGGQIAGVASDVSATSIEAADTWGGDGAGGPLVITFTPTEIGVVELVAECWGGSSYSLIVDDFDVTQA